MSFILLGILNSQVEGGAGGPGDYELLESDILTGSQSSVSFTDLTTKYASTYQHLQLRMVGRTDRASNGDSFILQFNSDTGTNYSGHTMRAEHTTLYQGGAGSQTYIELGYSEAANNTANSFAYCIAEIYNPFFTSQTTTVTAASGFNSSIGRTLQNQGRWNSASQVTTITISPLYGTNFVQYSRFGLYGYRSVAV